LVTHPASSRRARDEARTSTPLRSRLKRTESGPHPAIIAGKTAYLTNNETDLTLTSSASRRKHRLLHYPRSIDRT
jgi:hypothetical protein